MNESVRGDGRHRVSLYEVLQVSPRAEPQVIHAAYRVLARLYHPDVSRAPDAVQTMRRLNDAYTVLGHADRRTQYDARIAPVGRVLGSRQPERGRVGDRAGVSISPVAAPVARRFTSIPLQPERPPVAERVWPAPGRALQRGARAAVTVLVITLAVVATFALSTVIHAVIEPRVDSHILELGGS